MNSDERISTYIDAAKLDKYYVSILKSLPKPLTILLYQTEIPTTLLTFWHQSKLNRITTKYRLDDIREIQGNWTRDRAKYEMINKLMILRKGVENHKDS